MINKESTNTINVIFYCLALKYFGIPHSITMRRLVLARDRGIVWRNTEPHMLYCEWQGVAWYKGKGCFG